MQRFFGDNPRIAGFFLLIIAGAFTAMLAHAYQTGGSINWKVIWVTPFAWLFGIVYVLFPQFRIPKNGFRAAPVHSKLVNVILLCVGVGAALYLNFAVFKDWH